MKRLVEYFSDGITSQTLQTVGAEIETQFVYMDGNAIQTQTSQNILGDLAKNGWKVSGRKGEMITALTDHIGNMIYYELGRHNIEVATAASTTDKVLMTVENCLDQIYNSARCFGAKPYFAPILNGNEDLLVIPDDRDAGWLDLDGRSALAPLARTSSVQFTVAVSTDSAIQIVNRLGQNIVKFLNDYPQDSVWRQYIAESSAGYLANRYGGPLVFDSIDNYCRQLTVHNVVLGTKLVPFASSDSLDIPLYLRSIWWHFRLKRYNNALCVEVRPMARRKDNQFQRQLQMVLDIICG